VDIVADRFLGQSGARRCAQMSSVRQFEALKPEADNLASIAIDVDKSITQAVDTNDPPHASGMLFARKTSRVALRVKGRILFVDLADVIAVKAEGNYVSLERRSSTYILRGSISEMAKKLEPYGFIRIHRSIMVNGSLVEEIQPQLTGEYRLRVSGGRQYTVTRTYKRNLRFLAQLWLGTEGFRC
jgi:DNA-binding LytR/AlgR family response regulator